MADSITITEADLQKALQDPRYWMAGHPEREGFAGWVTKGFQALHGPEAKGGSVRVRAYTRQRQGKEEQVGAHTRGVPPSGAGNAGGSEPLIAGANTIDLLKPAQMWPFFARPPFHVPAPRPMGTPMRRIPRISGKEGAKDAPSFAHRFTRMVGERAEDFATRVMKENYGDNWRGNPIRDAEWRKIKKWGERAFEDPGILGFFVPGDA